MSQKATLKQKKPLDPQQVLDSIEQIVDYLWVDERWDYEATPSHRRKGHIFKSLKLVNAWLQSFNLIDEQSSPRPRHQLTRHRIKHDASEVRCWYCYRPLNAGDDAYSFGILFYCSHDCYAKCYRQQAS